MSNTHGPIWIVEEPAKPYPDGRFDGPAIPDGSTPVWASEMGMTPPLDPQQPTPDDVIADAARLAADDIALVFRLWPYSNAEALTNLLALHLLLAPPAPKWTAQETE